MWLYLLYWCLLPFPITQIPSPLRLFPRRELRKQCPRGSTWQSFHFNMWLRNKNWSFNFAVVIRLFESHENLYPPKGSAKAHPMGSNWFSYSLLSLVNEKWSLNFELVIRQKISVKNLYCADGRMDGWMDGWTRAFSRWKVLKIGRYAQIF